MSSTYSEAQLFHNCRERFITDAAGRNVLCNHLIGEKTYDTCWKSLIYWMER